jgi:uncharacterized integral membrane protein
MLGSTSILINLCKLLHVLIISLAVYFGSKIVQSKYVDKAYLQDTITSKSTPNLRTLTYTCWAVNLIFMIMISLFLLILANYIGTRPAQKNGSFLSFNMPTMLVFLKDFIVSIVLMLVIGLLIANALQKSKCSRYKDMGLRCIRSFSEILMMVWFVIAAIPYYKLVFNAT